MQKPINFTYDSPSDSSNTQFYNQRGVADCIFHAGGKYIYALRHFLENCSPILRAILYQDVEEEISKFNESEDGQFLKIQKVSQGIILVQLLQEDILCQVKDEP